MVVGRLVVASALVLAALPAAAADPLDDLNEPLCSTVWSFFCQYPVGSDPVAMANSELCGKVWSYFCSHEVGDTSDPEGAARDAVQPFLDLANGPLCSTVWSYFCANPVGLPA